ncbi:hypothetical protein COCMIDRAFT_39158 [Bipolaris oryzae ATCC 44560]|uniref:Uncharacterized protein n=1 Tax=Bipolaris oryzae ATCC 44560 TaxID=930090 RepID=W6YZ49_COCMI|nr:uncharacterized protein COCMIDRAFT_39158 [Bipolaris oryzae ATCC 44560]EUC42865.1 hypothetical protein COCMIDRAFT_39158 [Bipolaris oryzae ATCC 44560]
MVRSKSAEPNQKAVVDRLPSISGWMTERNAFRILSDICIQGYRDHGHRIGVIRGPDFSSLDGGLIFDPPEGFPMNMDPSAVWSWVNKHRQKDNLQIVPIDIKLSISTRSARQIAPIFIVAPPGNSEILCILPVNSYTALHANTKLEYQDSHTLVKDESIKAHRMRPREPLHISTLLAPFAVHRCDLFEALLRLKDAFKGQTTYTNPSNGVVMRGWTPPLPDCSPEKLMMILGERQKFSATTIQELAQLLRAQPEFQLELLFNLIQPLSCDLILRDKKSSTVYLIEHKTTTSRETKSDIVTLRPAPEWADYKLNWNFLLHQQGDWLAIHTREGHKARSSTPAVRVNIRSPDAISTFARTIQQTTATQKQSTRTITARKELFRIAFCDAINDQCYKLGKNACIILEGNACGDAVMVRHDWTERDTARYKANRTLPVSLVGGIRSGSLSALVLRFIAHNWPPRVPPSQIFEPTRVRTIEIPLCMSQPFIYVAATISSPSIDGQPILDQPILLPSGDTNWLVKYKGCKVCDSEIRTRNWRPVIQTLGEGQGAGQPGSSLIQLPFLKQDAEPLCHVYAFSNGSVHQHFDNLLCDQGSHYVTPIYGPNGLLQRQWNHGSPRMQNTGSSATHTMMCRVLTTLPPNTQPMATDHVESIYNEKKRCIVKERDCTESRAKDFSHQAMIGDDNYGMPLADIMAQSAFKTKYVLRCDYCEDEKSCRFYIPEIAYSRKVIPTCIGCYASKHACTFHGVMCLATSVLLIERCATIELSVYEKLVRMEASPAMNQIATRIVTWPTTTMGTLISRAIRIPYMRREIVSFIRDGSPAVDSGKITWPAHCPGSDGESNSGELFVEGRKVCARRGQCITSEKLYNTLREYFLGSCSHEPWHALRLKALAAIHRERRAGEKYTTSFWRKIQEKVDGPESIPAMVEK